MSWKARLAITALLSLAVLAPRIATPSQPAVAQVLPNCETASDVFTGCVPTGVYYDPTHFDEDEILLAPVGPGGLYVWVTMGQLADIYQASSTAQRVRILTGITPAQANRLVVAVLYRQARQPRPVVQPIPAAITPFSEAVQAPVATATATATPVPGATVTPVGCAITASVSQGVAAVGSTQTVFGRLLCNNSPVVGAPMSTVWNYPGFTQRCDGATTDASGTAACSLVVPSQPSGTVVPINVTINYSGINFGATTTFTVQ
jgi:hypothetical protein